MEHKVIFKALMINVTGGAKEEDNYSSIKHDLVSWNSEPVKSTQIPFIIILGTHIPSDEPF